MPRPSIAIIGASSNRQKFGNKCVRAYAAAGYEVFPVNPHATEIEGLKAYACLTQVPAAKLDRVSIYLRPEICLSVLDELARKPAAEYWFNPGADHPAVIEKARSLGLNVVVACAIVAVGANPYELS